MPKIPSTAGAKTQRSAIFVRFGNIANEGKICQKETTHRFVSETQLLLLGTVMFLWHLATVAEDSCRNAPFRRADAFAKHGDLPPGCAFRSTALLPGRHTSISARNEAAMLPASDAGIASQGFPYPIPDALI